MNIAVVVAGGVTETLQASPLLRTLRAGLPQARITLFCPVTARAVADGVPAPDATVGLRSLQGHPGPAAVWHVARLLRKLRLDAVLLCSAEANLRLAVYFSGVPRRVGPSGGVTGVLLSDRTGVTRHENRAAAWLRLPALLGVHQQLHTPAYDPGPEARHLADRVVAGSGFADGRLLVAISPGTGFAEPDTTPVASSGWDPERYAYLANQLSLRHGAGIVLLGAAVDRPAVERTLIDLGAHATDLSGDLDLRILASVLARCDLFVGSDTPLLHLAAAVGTPAVGLFGPTDGRERGPYGRDHRVIQAITGPSANGKAEGAMKSVMDQIRVEDVLASIEATL